MTKKEVYLPGMSIGEDEELTVDMSAYCFLHHLNVEWPSLSFDFIREKGKDTNVVCIVSGTQASENIQNRLMFMNIKGGVSDEEERDPILKDISVNMSSDTNRVRVTAGTDAFLTAVWSSDGIVHVYSVDGLFGDCCRIREVYSTKKHNTEGFGLGWSLEDNFLASGDQDGVLCIHEAPSSGLKLISSIKTTRGSIEDISWSPVEENVFGSCTTDGFLMLWDIRKKDPVVEKKIHSVDVNVISWNKIKTNLLASGCNNGGFSVWDLRKIEEGTSIENKWHGGDITSIEWSPTDESVLAVSGDDSQTTIWDFSIVESEKEEEFPIHLMFIHQGQQEVKEIHWHPTQHGFLTTTASTGFDLFKPISL